ncbi:hypothetical protein BDN72DRAFT_904138 [Pluteus cervinus]|uniref:Uncharacterized protein n=1 Tax=Pluteus cervinus TaxID=181527 RepID=A0ACD3A696_9AGAR|nr:hypothetical protein BDN72DRAFT_904138 [Pluteus cervinus]
MASTSSFSLYGLTPEAAYQKLDVEIARLESCLSAFRTLRNSLSPICKIPVGLLSKVLIHTQEWDDSTFCDDRDLHTRFSVSWVCRHWRDVALTTPSLWAVISAKKETILRSDFVEELLTRSCNAGLAVNLYKPSSDVLESCLAHMPRVQHFRLKYPYEERVVELVLEPAPIIVSLELINVALASTPIFSKVHPRLRHLVIEKVPFTISPSITPNLTTLRIVGPSWPIRVENLVNILPSLPHLTDVTLIQCLISAEDVVPPSPRPLLPSLQVLSVLDEGYNAVFDLLMCLDIPQAEVTVAWPAEYAGEITHSHLDDFWISIGGFLRGAQIFPVRHLRLDKDDADSTADISSSPLEHRYSFQFPQQKLDSYVTTYMWLNSDIPLDNLETLVTNDLPKGTLESLARLTKLRSIKIYTDEAVWTLLRGLCSPRNGSVLCPALKELILCGIDIENDDMPPIDEILWARHAAGFGLDRLVFVGCRSVDVIDDFKFKKFVEVVEVVN